MKKKLKKVILFALCFGFGTNKLEKNFRNILFGVKNVTESAVRLGAIVHLFTEASLGLKDVYFTSASTQHICFKNNFAMPKRLKKDETQGRRISRRRNRGSG